MNDKTIGQKVRAIIAEQFEVGEEEITPTALLFREFQADSLDILDIVMLVQKEFGIKIREEDLESLGRLCDFVAYIEKNQPSAKA